MAIPIFDELTFDGELWKIQTPVFSVPNNTDFYFGIQTGADLTAIEIYNIDTESGKTIVRIFEGSSADSISSVANYKFNRRVLSDDSQPDYLPFISDSTASDGSLVSEIIFLGDKGKANLASNDLLFLMKSKTRYGISVRNEGGGTQDYSAEVIISSGIRRFS